MKVGFYAWNLFQVQHAAALLRRFEGGELVFHERGGVKADSVLDHPTIAEVAGRARICRGREVLALDQELDALVFQTPFPWIDGFERARLVALQYSMAKERHQYGPWRAIADLNLVYGPWSAQRIAPFGPVAQVGNPRWADHFDVPPPALAEVVPGYDPAKPTLLYLPTWEELSSLPEFGEALAALRSRYNLLFLPHHNSLRFEDERTRVALKVITGSGTPTRAVDVGQLIRACDAVLSDFSGAIFDALLFGKPLLLLQGDAPAKVDRKFGPESIEFARRDEIGPVVERPEELPARLDDLLSGRLDFAAAHRRLRQDCFAATRESADLAAAAIEAAVRQRPERPAHQLYLRQFCRENQARATQLRELQGQRRRRGRRPALAMLDRLPRPGLRAGIDALAQGLFRLTEGMPEAGGAKLALLRSLLTSRLLVELARRHEAAGRSELARAYTLAAFAKGTARSFGWTTLFFARQQDPAWRERVLEVAFARSPQAFDSLLLRASRLQNIARSHHEAFARRRLEARARVLEELRDGTRVERNLRIAFGNRWIGEAEALLQAAEWRTPAVQSYRQGVKVIRARLAEFAPLTDIANRNEAENRLSGDFECLLGGEVCRRSALPPGTPVVELPLPPYFYSMTVTDAQAHDRICRFLRRVYREVFAGGAAVLPRHQFMLTHADPGGLADVVLSYHTCGAAPGHWHIKDAPLPGYFSIDPEGYAGWSSLAALEALPATIAAVGPAELEANLAALRRETIEANRSKYAQPARGDAQALPERFVFVPLQVMDDAVQQLARIPLERLVTAMTAYARQGREAVVFKRHPACDSPEVERLLRQAVRTPGVQLAEASIHDLLSRARAVVTINSGVGLEALIHMKPVILAGRAEYAYACAQVADEAELQAALTELPFDAAWQDRILRFLYFYRRHQLLHEDDDAALRARIQAILPAAPPLRQGGAPRDRAASTPARAVP